MSSSIYTIQSWQSSTFYSKNSIITDGTYYYYANTNHTSASVFLTDYNNGLWGGITSDRGETKPHFIWKASYKFTVNNEPKIRKIQFGDGYTQRIADGINNILPKMNFTFENIDLDEYTAILHFLEIRRGSESFMFLPPAPRGQFGRFVCEKWDDTQNFFNNYTINATFERSIT
ncbi:MAG: phage tail protein [Nanoarchaeota archaeon]